MWLPGESDQSSLKYHRLHPEYIHVRIEKLGISYNLRILLILCDITEHQEPIRELTKTCLVNNITIIVAFSYEDAGHYLTTFKQFEHKPPDLIKERVDKDYDSVLRTTLTSIPKINKTDVETLKSTFGSFGEIAGATTEQLSTLPGFGKVKVKNLKHALDAPFRARSSNTLDTTFPSSQSSQTAHVASVNVAESPPWGIEGEEELAVQPTSNTKEISTVDKGKGKERAPSPEWNIELDLNDSDG